MFIKTQITKSAKMGAVKNSKKTKLAAPRCAMVIYCLLVGDVYANPADKTLLSMADIPAMSALDILADIDEVTEDDFEIQTPTARGVLKAGEEAIISSSMSGRLISARYKPGEFFKSGALLAAFDCSQEKAELNALNQAHETWSIKWENQSQLYAAGAAGALDVSVAKSEMQQADAERKALRARLKKCKVHAPYSGRVVEKHIAAYESPAVNAPLYTIHKAGALEISVIIPSAWMKWVETGTNFTFKVDETEREIKGKVLRTGASVDPVSQTIEITAKTVGPIGKTLAGMSGVANFPEISENE